ncbi:MAG: hypothetical protein OXQ29_11250, partial [Rhodospirillaceae bacterium]|nr:hypothetical protein [Rhodospirillaceae bacterium]
EFVTVPGHHHLLFELDALSAPSLLNEDTNCGTNVVFSLMTPRLERGNMTFPCPRCNREGRARAWW